MNIEKYIKEAGENVNYDCSECDKDGKIYNDSQNYYEDCTTCNGTGKAPLSISDMLCDIIEALMDARRAHKEGRLAEDGRWILYRNYLKNTIYTVSEAFEKSLKGTREDHIADAFIRLFEIYVYLELEYTLDPTLSIDCYENVSEQLLEFSGIIYRLKNRILYGMKETANFHCSELIQYLEYFCNKNNIPIEKHIEAKLKYNRANK